MNQIERNVGIDPFQQLYVIKEASGALHTYGWDYVKDRCERMALNLVIETYEHPPTGTVEAYDSMEMLLHLLRAQYDRTGERPVFDLTMDLVGLEGHRVEVVDEEGDAPRRFIVGRSSGWCPVHLEIKTTRSMGGDPARREYHSVTDLGPTNR